MPPRRVKAAKRLGKRSSLVSSIEDTLNELVDCGFLIIYTGQSAEFHPKIRGIAGYRVLYGSNLSTSACPPFDLRHTVNSAQLNAAMQTLDDTFRLKSALSPLMSV
uniref:Uncharacterized protein n=1 Tax=Eutreptiella gymnastica TaxID=73025 RepID=A0A7S1NP77_9EUGL|mmetsp:Transcript_59855/g.106789  ORF Transcript_59855/g.106789 Transcript_59855/m.106789 type:complete len:106 (+) Transcript_59855:64-381(+)